MDETRRERRRFRFSYGFIAVATLVVMAVYALASAVWLARDILFITFLAILFALFLSIFIERLEPWMSRILATALIMVTLILLQIGFLLLVWPTLETQIITIRREVPPTLDYVGDWLETQYRSVFGQMDADNEFQAQLRTRMNTEAARIVAGALPLLNTALGAFAGFFLVVFGGAFLAMNPKLYLEGGLELVPLRIRSRLRDALLEAGIGLRRWMAGMVISMLAIFAATTIGLWLLGVPAFLALGVIAGILNFIPFVGPILSAVPAMAVALTISPSMVLWVALLYLAVQQAESNLLIPVIMRRAVYLAPATTLLFQMVMAVLFGFLGLVVAVPLLAVMRILVRRLYVERLYEPGDEAADAYSGEVGPDSGVDEARYDDAPYDDERSGGPRPPEAQPGSAER